MKNDKGIKTIICLLCVIIGLLTLNTVVLIVKNFDSNNVSGTTNNNNNNDNDSDQTFDSDYDTSSLDSMNVSQILALFDKKDTKVVYMGRSTCSACVSFLPNLVTAQEEYGFTSIYLDITTVNKNSNDFTKFIKKLDKEYTLNNETDTFGYFYGYTPAVFIIKNGKMADGFIGGYSYDSLTSFLEENGFSKN